MRSLSRDASPVAHAPGSPKTFVRLQIMNEIAYADPAQPELAWRNYSGWAMLPSFVGCGFLSAALLMSRWFFDEARGIEDKIGSWALFAATWSIWLVQLFRWLYRGSCYVYRLTPTAIYIDRGFLYNPQPPLLLANVLEAKWGANILGRFFGVGWVVVFLQDGGVYTLTGVLRPAALAEEIQAAASRMKSSGVTNSLVNSQPLPPG